MLFIQGLAALIAMGASIKRSAFDTTRSQRVRPMYDDLISVLPLGFVTQVVEYLDPT